MLLLKQPDCETEKKEVNLYISSQYGESKGSSRWTLVQKNYNKYRKINTLSNVYTSTKLNQQHVFLLLKN